MNGLRTVRANHCAGAQNRIISSRATGYVNWSRGRKRSHDMEILAELVADLLAAKPDHIACTGDLCNIGLPKEWPTSRLFLETLGPPDAVSFVPGNHDAYVRGSLKGLMAECAPFTRGDDGVEGVFPYLRRRGDLALIGLSSAIPTAPFVASGRLGKAQIAATEAMLSDLGNDPTRPARVVMIHHPPHVAGAQPGRNLTDARAFEAMLGRAGAELVLHGHNHIGSVAFLPGPKRPVPVVGAPSASARGGLIVHRAGYHFITIDREGEGFAITAALRGLTPEGLIADLGNLSLNA